MTKYQFLLASVILFASCAQDEDIIVTPTLDCQDAPSVFSIALTTDGCTQDIATQLNTQSRFEVADQGNTTTIQLNGIPNHLIGTFPNANNPNRVAEQNRTFTVTNSPAVANTITSAKRWIGGVLHSGVLLETYTAEYFVGSSGQTNFDWNITSFQSARSLGLDCNNGHVQPSGNYHYHGLPNALGAALGIDGRAMVKVGVAADGFPIYYKFIQDETGEVKTAVASYQLIDGQRTGDGISAPDGCYNGFYVQDYVFSPNFGDLDECNGFFGPTPEVPAGEYYYVLTENYPSAPLCFSGTPHASFSI